MTRTTLIPLATALLTTPLLAQGSPDCNGNGIPDADDLANGTSSDCNLDGVPDECVTCRLDVVFIMDTSQSMDAEGRALCQATATIESDLAQLGFDLEVSRFSINRSNPFGASSPYACLGGNSIITPQDGLSGQLEDWGPATEIQAEAHPWRSGAVRVMVPISDEAPFRGGGCNDPGNDRDSITDAIAACLRNDVTVFPILGSGFGACTEGLADDLAQGTGGSTFRSSNAAADIPPAIQSLIQTSCTNAADCNDNGILDECEFVSYGIGKAGTHGVPRLSAGGCPQGGQVITVTIDQGPAGSIACLYFGSAPATVPFLDATLLVAPPMQAFFSPILQPDASTGQGISLLNLPLPPQLAGTSLYAQAGLTDAGAPLGFTMTQGLELRISN